MIDRETIRTRMAEEHYIADETIVTTLYISLLLERPLLIEGAAGVGKTEIAKVAARVLGRELIRLQCYEGLDEAKSLYEWNYQKQLLAIQMGAEGMKDLFSEDFLLERPLLKSIRSAEPTVLLIDEIDKADAEFEAFLLELLSEQQISIPEYGTLHARTIPFIVLTSNRARPISDALRRRCAYLYIDYPDIEKETAILRAKVPDADETMVRRIAKAAAWLRRNQHILKKPSVSESIDWASAVLALGAKDLDDENALLTLGFALKNNEDILEVCKDEEFIRDLLS